VSRTAPRHPTRGSRDLIWRLRESGQSLEEIAAELAGRGYHSGWGSPWRPNAIRQTLRRMAVDYGLPEPPAHPADAPELGLAEAERLSGLSAIPKPKPPEDPQSADA